MSLEQNESLGLKGVLVKLIGRVGMVFKVVQVLLVVG